LARAARESFAAHTLDDIERWHNHVLLSQHLDQSLGEYDATVGLLSQLGELVHEAPVVGDGKRRQVEPRLQFRQVLAPLGRSNASDTEIMAFAKANDYVVLTHDLDFGAILAATHGNKPSVVQIRSEDVSPDVIGKSIIVALRQMTAELEEGALVTLDPNRPRLRVLPLSLRE
jgi:predicted nuclease of predicted toxin-antitoxin system